MMDQETAKRIMRQLAHERAGQKALVERMADLMNRFKQERIKVRALEKWAEKAQQQIKYIEDIKGKRIPYLLNFEIQLPPSAAQTPTGVSEGIGSISKQVFTATQQVSMDGPFIATHYMGAIQLKTYSLGPTDDRPDDAAAGVEVQTPLTGRFRPLASSNDPFSGAYIGPGTSVLAPGITAVNTPRPGELDFLWELSDGASTRARQNDLPSPSRYLFSEVDRPYYLGVSDFFTQGANITFRMTPTRDMDLVEMAYVGYNGYAGGEGADITGLNPDRRVFALGGTLHFTMGGYKILQAQTAGI